jgi:glycosyltransferase involved in cell wall biosynthesis
LRVVYDHQVFSLQNAGGASRYHYELLRYLSNVQGVQTELFLGLEQSAYPLRKLSSATTRVVGVAAPVRPGMLRYALNEAWETAYSFFDGKCDIYHPTYFRCLPTIRSRRIVTTHHDCTYEQFPHLFRDAAMVIRSRRAMFAKVDMVLCISEASRRCLLEFYPLKPEQTRVVRHGLAPLARSQQAAEELQTHLRRGFVLYVGARNAHKNFAALLEAFHESGLRQDYDLLALGGGPLTNIEKAKITALGLDSSVLVMPFVADELLAEAYARAALFVYPSLSEGFGIPPLEAMAAGCPVAASQVSAIPEVCQDAPIYFDPYDVGSMARALRTGVADGEVRSSAIAKGKRVAAGYSWEKCGSETLAAYRECL